MRSLTFGGIVGILIGISIGSLPLRGQEQFQARYFIDSADELARKLDSRNPDEVNYARGYVAGAYDAWIVTTSRTEQGHKITSCVPIQKPLASSNIATIFEAYLIKHPGLAHTLAWPVLEAAFDETCGIE
jgi:hypothetical protein